MQDNTNSTHTHESDEKNSADLATKNADNNSSAAPHTNFGSGPSGHIADGGDGGEKQPKEKTGKDSTMGGADGGTTGMGYSKETVEPQQKD